MGGCSPGGDVQMKGTKFFGGWKGKTEKREINCVDLYNSGWSVNRLAKKYGDREFVKKALGFKK